MEYQPGRWHGMNYMRVNYGEQHADKNRRFNVNCALAAADRRNFGMTCIGLRRRFIRQPRNASAAVCYEPLDDDAAGGCEHAKEVETAL